MSLLFRCKVWPMLSLETPIPESRAVTTYALRLRCPASQKLRLRHTREYECWASMKGRCLTPSCTGFEDYGGRGIKVCDRWLHDFGAFLKDMGPRPLSHSIHRLDNDGDYTPENCKWATAAEQAREKRSNVYLEFGGERLIKADWARRFGMSRWSFREQLNKGRTLAELVAAHKLPRAA
jgi:hypothetical protein